MRVKGRLLIAINDEIHQLKLGTNASRKFMQINLIN